MSKPKKQIAGVLVDRSGRERSEIRSAITWLDVKVLEFLDRLNSREGRFRRRDAYDFSEILGALKFMYMAEIITADEFKSVIREITGEEITAEDMA